MQSIFKWFTLEGANARILWFTERFGPEEFTGVDKLLLLFLKYCADMDIVAQKKYLEIFLETESKKAIKKYNIRVDMMENFNYDEPGALEEARFVIAAAAITAYDQYTAVPLSTDSFKVMMKTFMIKRKDDRVLEIMSNSYPAIVGGGDTEEIIDDIQYELSQVASVYNLSYIDKLDFLEGRTHNSDEQEEMEFLFKTHVPCIDGDVGGVFSRMLFSLVGSPGTGKTRFASIVFAYQAMLQGHDVLFDELELQKSEVKNMLIAHHIVNLYNGKIKIPDSLMKSKKLLSPEQLRYYEAARIDLFESGKYGNIFIRTDMLVVEKLRRDIHNFLKRNTKVRFWVIDYAGLAKSEPQSKYEPKKIRYEIIQDLYETTKGICKDCDIAALIVNQFSDEGNKASMAGKVIIPGHTQGGQVVERHCDYSLAMCMTEEQDAANMFTLSTTKKRAAPGFRFVPFAKDLSVSIFRQLDQSALN